MASSTESRLRDPGYKRYILAGLALDHMCKALELYEDQVVTQLHVDLMKTHSKPVCHDNTHKYKEVQGCRNPSCGPSVAILEGAHYRGTGKLNWKNSDIEQWSTNKWSIALLYMNPGQSVSSNTAPSDTDISGVVNLLTHCNRFMADRNTLDQIRDARNRLIHHSPNFTVTDKTFKDLVDLILSLLADLDTNGHFKTAQPHIDEFKQMKQMTFDVTFEKEVQVLQAAIDTAQQEAGEINKKMEEMKIDLKSNRDDISANRDAIGAKQDTINDFDKNHKQLVIHLDEHIKKHTDLWSELKPQITGLSQDVANNTSRIQGIETQLGDLDRRVTCLGDTTGLTAHELRQRLIHVYKRPEYHQDRPFLDGTVHGSYLMDSLYVEVGVERKDSRPDIMGTNIKGVPVANALDMLPTQGHRVCIEGFPGSGKSFWVISLARDYSKTTSHTGSTQSAPDASPLDKYSLLILLQTRSLDKSVYNTIKCLLYGDDNMEVAPEDIQRILTSSSCPPVLLLLDGYDEGTRLQQEIIDKIISSKTLPHINVLVTSRPGQIRDISKFNNCYINLGFNEEQKLLFLEKFTLLQEPKGQDRMMEFRKHFEESEELKFLFNAPIMAMTTSYMVVSGHHVQFKSRIGLYHELVDFVIARACNKLEGVKEAKSIEKDIHEVMPAFEKATFEQLVKNNCYYISRADIESELSEAQIDNILINIGFISVTKYGYGKHVQSTFTYVHKTIAEYIGARHLVSLPLTEGAEAMNRLFQSGPANQEVIRMALGLCSKEKPDHLVPLYRIIASKFIDEAEPRKDQQPDHPRMPLHRRIASMFRGSAELRKDQKVIDTVSTVSGTGSNYLLLLLADLDMKKLVEVDTGTPLAAAVCELGHVSASIWRADIKKEAVTGIDHDSIDIDWRSASALYSGLQLAAHRVQRSLDTVRRMEVKCWPYSSHSAATRLPATIAACAPSMTALKRVHVHRLASATELGAVCGGLAASRAPQLISLELEGDYNSDMNTKAGGDLGALVQLIRAAPQLTELQLTYIHAGEEQQFVEMCDAVEEAPQLTRLWLWRCSVSAQQYSAVLVPTLTRRRTARGTKLQQVWLWGVWGTDEERTRCLEAALRDVAEKVTVT